MGTNKKLKKAGDNLNDKEIMREIHKAVGETIDKAIAEYLGVECRERKYLDCDPISDLKDMIVRDTTVIVCHPNTKNQIEEYDLPPMMKIFHSLYLEEGKAYLITDEKMKRIFLESEIPIHIE